MIPTSDPDVMIQEKSDGYVRYIHTDGRRWEVIGTCDRRGACLVGAVIQTPDGPVEVRSLEHLEQLKQQLGRERIDSELDVPVGVGFSGCCPLEVRILI